MSGLKLLTRCPLEDVGQLFHRMLDAKCGRAAPSYSTYSSTFSLEEWWQLMDGCQALCAAYMSNAWTDSQLTEHLSDLSTEYQSIVIHILATRREDLRLSVVDSINNISNASLVDFDWRAKVVVSSDKMASIWEPVVSLDLNVNTPNEDKKSISLELDRDELKKLISSLEAADRIVTQLT